MSPLADQLADLLRYAERGGADPAWVREVIRPLLELLLDDATARRLEAQERQIEVERLSDGGLTIAAACTRVGVSRRTFYNRRRVPSGGTASPGAITRALRSWR